MTIDELLDKIKRAQRAGKIDGDDSVYLRDPDVSEGAISAGSSPWAEADEILVIDGNDEIPAGIYLTIEER